MRLKRGVDARGADPDLWALLGEIDVLHAAAVGQGVVVTSLRRRRSRRASLHSPKAPKLVQAADLRRHQLDAQHQAESFCHSLQRIYGRWLGVVLEPEWLTEKQIRARGGIQRIDPHIHVQLKRPHWPRVR
mgnify:CR=1 FL=1